MSNLVFGNSLVPLYLGNGSTNMTYDTYNSKVSINRSLMSVPNWTRNGNINQFPSQNLPAVFIDHTPRGTQQKARFFSGTNTYTFVAGNSIIQPNRVVSVLIQWAYLSGNITFSSFQVRLNGSLTTLANAVTNNLIRPWLGTATWYSAPSQPYVSSTSNNFQTGGSVNASFSFADICFVLNSSTTMDAMSFNASQASSTADNFNDGWLVRSYSYSTYPVTIAR